MKTLCSAIGITAVSTLLAACSTPTHIHLPAELIPAANEKTAFTWSAVGSQIYECKANAGGAIAWTFVAPEAELFNAKKERVGSHGAGPHWTALDGSKTVGQVKARANARRSVDIPWLLLTAKSAAGPGRMAAVTSVQRINTVDGVAPSVGCVVNSDLGKISKQGYTADYVYFVPR
jgi:hypothetical protein